jgi:hypothetical protein
MSGYWPGSGVESGVVFELAAHFLRGYGHPPFTFLDHFRKELGEVNRLFLPGRCCRPNDLPEQESESTIMSQR